MATEMGGCKRNERVEGGVLCAFVDSNCLKQEGYSANERSQAKAKEKNKKKKKMKK